MSSSHPKDESPAPSDESPSPRDGSPDPKDESDSAQDKALAAPAAADSDGEDGGDGDDDDDDDYMNMIIEEPGKKETALQRLQREKRERVERSQNHKTKREQEEEAAATREAALNKAIDSSNKGFKMLAKMGFKEGGKLGKSDYGVAEPVRVQIKDGREGIGMESEKKRKLREVYEEHAKKAKVEQETEEQYFASMAQERKNKRSEGQFIGAQKAAEKLDTEPGEATNATVVDKSTPLKNIPLVWRGLVRFRMEKESEGLMRKALGERLTRLPTYDDDEEDEDDQLGLGKQAKAKVVVHEDLGEEDTELEEFDALEPHKKLEMAVQYLRDKHNYCFWCKYKYADEEEMESCPGLTEEDHD
ncbi:coiled-coil domain-containing protein 75 [Diplodia corticola]|uniref:Coiled-coil domain-containing protein 75 n=1 Tax=Diplodia corticola TaxID=236234 RepID=A0A1J9QLG1_9PEZI|nr:coiled-coil domain-containing protein 75 [Diplodia corticola]OJD29289.1 coiled-coil domain-containing protein 75 [Diplodia corticola]